MNEQIIIEKTKVAQTMIMCGTIFERRLGRALAIGDTEECAKLKATWPELWEKYLNLVLDAGEDFGNIAFFEKNPPADWDAIGEILGFYTDALQMGNTAVEVCTKALKRVYLLLSGSEPNKVNKAMAIIVPLLANDPILRKPGKKD